MTTEENKSLLKIALIIVVVLYLVFTFCPQILPSGIWRNKTVRKFNRNNRMVYETIVGSADPNVVHQPVKSYYKTFTKEQYGANAIVVGLHYVDWCGYCKRMKPVWDKLKNDLSTTEYSGVVMIENDEEAKPTPGVDSYPTIYKMRNGKMQKYKGRADYSQLREFVLGTSMIDTYGSAF